jgi:hypothetical protein
MARPVVGIYASVAPASWGPWHERPSVLAPAALGEALRQAGAMVVLLAPDPDLERLELLHGLDALILPSTTRNRDALAAAARAAGLAVLVLDAALVTNDATVDDFASAIDAGLASVWRRS